MIALVPMAGESGADGYWARVLLCVDHASGVILSTDALGPEDGIQDAFLQALERAEYIPQALKLSSGLLETELTPIVDALGIDVQFVDELPGVDEASAAMKAAFRR